MVVVTAVAEEVTEVVEEATVVEAADTEEEVVDMVVRNLATSSSPHCSCQCSQVLVDMEEADMAVAGTEEAALLEACFDDNLIVAS